MADTPLASVVRHIRKLVRSPESAGEADAQLLERYIQQRDENAFSALVRRHGPLVWRVCRRVLKHTQCAEEVYQATFLVLARRAARVRNPATLASYLYSVAYRMALKVRADLRRRQARQAEPIAEPAADPASEAACRELECILVEEVHALAEKYRTPILLCYWEGLTNEEAARRLGWPMGTVKTRLLKARQLLHKRLTRRGVSLSVGAIITLLASGGGDAAMPPSLTAGAVSAVLGGTTGVPAAAAALAEQAIRGMIYVKVRLLAALLLLVGGTVTLAYHALGARQAEEQRAVQPNPPAKEAALPRPAKEKQQPRADCLGDPLPAGAVARLGTRRLCGAVDSMWLRFSPDGSKIASQGLFFLTVWDAASGKQQIQRMNYDPLVNGMAWRNNGTGVAVVRLPDRSYFVSEFTNVSEELPNPPPAPPPKVIPNPGPDGIDSVALSPDATQLAIVRNPDKEEIRIDLITVATGRLVGELKRERTLGPFEGACKEVRYYTNGQLMILSSPPKNKGDWVLTIIDPQNNRVCRKARILPPGYCPWKYMLNLSADARWAAIPPRRSDGPNDHDGTIRIWDLDAGKELRSLPFEQRGYGTGHALTPDGKRLITSSSKSYFQIWDLATEKEAARSPEQYSTEWGEASAVAVSMDGQHFATARQGDGLVDIWDMRTGKLIVTLDTHRDAINAVAVSPDNRLAATLGCDGFLRTWELDTGQAKRLAPISSVDRTIERSWARPRLRFTPDGRGLLFRGSDGLTLIDPHTGKQLVLPAALEKRREHFGGFSADGRTLATFTADKVTLWDWPSANVRVTFNVPLNPQRPADIKKGPESVEVNSVALSADGRLVFTNSTRRQNDPGRGGYQNSNDVWDGRSGKLLHRLTSPETEHPPGVFSPDGRVLYVGGHSLNFRGRREADALTAWDRSIGTLLRRFAEPERGAKLSLHERLGRMVNSLALSPDGRLLAVGEEPHAPGDRLWLYETASGRIIKALQGHDRQVTDLTFTPDGRRLVSVSEDHTGLVWDVTVPALGDTAVTQLAQAWERLAELDPKPAYNAMAALTAKPKEAIALLREKLHPAPIPTDVELDRLVEQLDADAFADRQKAVAELERFGPNAVAGVKVRLKQSPPLEVRKRLLLFLEKYDGPNPHQLRCIRAVAVLEAMNTAEARALLAKLTKGPPNDVLTHEAQTASHRLTR
jgi:RNA polymerase sigma factor (sigma-70 family)